MSSNCLRRVHKELSDIAKDTSSQVFAEVGPGQDLTSIRATIPGPPDTPYEGGIFIIDIQIPTEYPFKPPVMKFVTRVWHPNISSQTGAICLDTLGSAWSPVLTIKAALLSLQSLLSSPEPKDPQDAEVATMMMNYPDKFHQVAHEWAVRYAGAPQVVKWSEAVAKQVPTQPKVKAQRSSEEERRVQAARYQGYNRDLIDRFVNMGFDIDRVVDAFIFVNIDRNNGEDYELEEAYMGDITARLLGEP